MQKVLTAAEMREVDRLTTEKYGIPSIILMENAAHAVARVITEKLGGSVKGKSILILCGKGNNGGDGAALARILWQNGSEVIVCLLGKITDTSGDARINFDSLSHLSKLEITKSNQAEIILYECSSEADWDGLLKKHFNCDDPKIIIDALFGTGLTKPLAGIHETVARWVRGFNVEGVGQDMLIVSIDLPSGLDADGLYWIGQSLRAHTTLTFTAPKLANIIPPVHDFTGELIVADIGSPSELIDAQPSQLFLTEKEDLDQWLYKSQFSNDSYKNKRGHALLIAGSEDYSGAAVLAGNAAMRSGVGLVTVAAPNDCKAEIASRLLPDVILTGIDTGPDEPELLTKADAIAVGCGLSATDPVIEKLVRKVVATREVPVIIDAGALWFYSPFEMQKPARSKGIATLILTPHEGEFLRLLGTDDKDAIKDRVAAAREFSQKHNVILVLKGERVLIGEPGGKVVVNPTGNSGLGKAGNGDTLTGIIAGFVAQAVKMEIDIFESVVAAVYVAGMAGDIAEKKYGKRVMTASDVRECLVEAFAQFENRER